MTATAQPQIELQPLEWAIVRALHAHGTLTTSALVAAVAEAGHACTRGSLRTRLHTLTRFAVVLRVKEGGGRQWQESRYRLRIQG